ncbi:MAG: hypothetical protein HQM12_14435 [SAR324 cluster bacterium]|nr:hypothetical protein [SAR324 cluster bacterium]
MLNILHQSSPVSKKYSFLFSYKFALVIMALIVSTISAYHAFTDPSAYREHYHGDLITELEAYTSGLNFEKHGFIQLYFLPALHTYEEARVTQPMYTHFPPGSNVMSGVMQKIGLHQFYSQKKAMLILNIVALVFFILSIRHLIPTSDHFPEIVFGVILINSAWQIFWLGNISLYTYSDLITAVALWALVTNRTKIYLTMCFLAMCVNFELVPFLGLMSWYLAINNHKKGIWNRLQSVIYVGMTGGVFFLGFALHFLQNAFYFGSVNAAYLDFQKAFLERTSIIPSDVDYSIVKK